MSTIPQSLEEAVASLQKILDHPKTAVAIRREPKALVQFRNGIPKGEISERLATNPSDSWAKKIVGQLWVNVFYVAAINGTHCCLVIFAENEMENPQPRFGVWDRDTTSLWSTPTSEISEELESMQRVLDVVVQKTLGSYHEPSIPHYITRTV